VKVVLLPLQPLAHGIMQVLVIGLMLSFQGENSVWTEWVWQHCLSKFCEGLSGAHTSEHPDIVLEGHLSHCSYWTK
jgi:hypothetical protein